MPKEIKSIRLEPEVWELLNKLCALDDRSQAYVIAKLIKEAAKKAGIKR